MHKILQGKDRNGNVAVTERGAQAEKQEGQRGGRKNEEKGRE